MNKNYEKILVHGYQIFRIKQDEITPQTQLIRRNTIQLSGKFKKILYFSSRDISLGCKT